MEKPEKVPVLIVGGGVVGLSASLFLSRLGIQPLLIERHPSTCIHPRARGINPRTMEINRGYGLFDAIKKGGENLKDAKGIYEGATMVEISKRKPKLYYGGIILAGLLALSLFAYSLGGLFAVKLALFSLFTLCTALGVAAWRYMKGVSGRHIFCTQDILEPILLAKAKELGVDARFNTELVDVTQNDSEVTATILDRVSGKKYVVTCQYLLAADGARSPMRSRLNIPFEGPPPFSRQLNLLFKADLAHLTKNGLFSLISIKQSNFRAGIATINGSDIWCIHVVVPPNANPEDYPHEKRLEFIRAAVGIPDLEVEVKAAMTWDAQVKVIRDYQQGRILFAGDAAHAMPPWGGFGANTGVQDAHNLAWKIAAVIKGEAGPKLLETYQIERKPVAENVTKISGSLSDPDNGLMHTSWLQIVPRILKALPYFRVGYGYASSAVILEPGLPTPGPLMNDLDGRPGTRVPHVEVTINNTLISTMDLCLTGLTVFCGPKANKINVALQQAAQKLKFEKIQIFTEGVDFKENVIAAFGIQEDGALLVRPDQFVAWRVVSEATVASEEALTVLTKLYSRE